MFTFIESHRFCDRVQDAYTMRCCPQVSLMGGETVVCGHFIWRSLSLINTMLVFAGPWHRQ